MNFKIFLISILSLVFSVAVSACGSCDKINKAKNPATVETEFPKPDNSVQAESDDPLFFMETLTGYKNIVEIHEEIDIGKIKEMLKNIDSGETDSMGRRYFAYSVPSLRQAPVSMPQRRFDIESCMDKAAEELKRAYTGDITLIARRLDKVVTYVVLNDGDNYGYGAFYIVSAIPIEFQISPDNDEVSLEEPQSLPD
jgi:hypothetical protein